MSKSKDADVIEWNATSESLLLYAMIGHKPVAVNRYFMMTCIHDQFSKFINKQISSKPLWDHFNTMYNMAVLNESEVIPFPNEEIEFELPGDEFDSIAKDRLGIALPHSEVKPEVKDSNIKHVKKVGQTRTRFHPPMPISIKPKELMLEMAIPSTSAMRTPKAASQKSEQSSVKHDSSNIKPKRDQSPTTRNLKVKKSNSVVPSKDLKSEPSSSTIIKKESTEVTVKKTMKQEVAQSKKAIKEEAEDEDATDSKKKDNNSSKKNKLNSNSENTGNKRNGKNDSKSDISKRKGDVTPKATKTENKNSQSSSKSVKSEDSDSHASSKSTKSQGKDDQSDSNKTRKRTRVEEVQSQKKTQQQPLKRRKN